MFFCKQFKSSVLFLYLVDAPTINSITSAVSIPPSDELQVVKGELTSIESLNYLLPLNQSSGFCFKWLKLSGIQ